MSYEQGMDALARELSEVGVPRQHSHDVAYGVLDRLRRWCWQNHTDLLGEADAIDGVIGWTGDRGGVIAPLLYRSGLAGSTMGVYHLPSATRECPEYLRQKWRRLDREGYALAVARAAAPLSTSRWSCARKPTAPEPPPVEPVLDIPEGLWVSDAEAPPEEKKRERKLKGQPGHNELVAHFCDTWAARHGGTKYPFTGADASHIKRVLVASGDLTKARQVIDAFFASTDRWHRQRGFRLGLLVNDLPLFLAKAGGHIAAPGGLAYSGAGTSILDAGEGQS